MKKLGILKFILFEDANEASASDLPIRFNEFAAIKGDPLSLKRGIGNSYGDGPPYRSLPLALTLNPDGSLTINGPLITKHTAFARNTTSAITAAQLKQGLITSTSAAPVTVTLPTAALLGAALGAALGTEFRFLVDNRGGANPVTIALGAGITAAPNAGSLVVAAGTLVAFDLYFTSATAALITRKTFGNTIPWFSPIAAEQALSGAGAINLTTFLTSVTTTGANALTLADSTVIGQVKKIKLVVDGGDGTLTLTGYTSITFNDAGDFVLLQWSGTAWVALENSGCTIV